VEFGVQVPVHAPETQAWLVQVTGELQVPLLAHVSTPLPAHVTAPGVQTPVHAPETHALLKHAWGLPQVPPFEHVSTPLFAHCLAFGEHAAQAPLRHTGVAPVQLVDGPHWPVASHVCTS
jgi:hypothetical protein